VSAPVAWLPLVANVPLQLPEAVQDVAFVELHVSVDAPPLAIAVGDAASVAVGAGGGGGGGVTVTLATTAVLVPPAPVQVNE